MLTSTHNWTWPVSGFTLAGHTRILKSSEAIEASNSSAGDVTNVLTYENSTYGVKMQYPDDWTVGRVNTTDTTGNFANFLSPNSEVVQISIDGLGSSGFPLNDYLTRSIDGYKSNPQAFPNFQLISPSGVIIASYERAGEVKTGSFGLETPSEAELARRKRLKEEK